MFSGGGSTGHGRIGGIGWAHDVSLDILLLLFVSLPRPKHYDWSIASLSLYDVISACL